jgi:hypothetical protein
MHPNFIPFRCFVANQNAPGAHRAPGAYGEKWWFSRGCQVLNPILLAHQIPRFYQYQSVISARTAKPNTINVDSIPIRDNKSPPIW